MRSNQKGFSIVEATLMIAVVGLIGVVGWLVYDKQKASVNSTVAESSASADKEKVNPEFKDNEKAEKIRLSSDWLVYQPKNGDYSLSLPNGTEFVSNPDSSFIYTRSKLEKSSEKATVVEATRGSDNPVGLFIGMGQDRYTIRGEKQENLVTYSGATVDKYKYVQNNPPQAIDIPQGATEYLYLLKKGDSHLSITYNVLDSGDVELVEEMVKTAAIK